MTLKDQYTSLLQKLLPTGQAWNRDLDATTTKVLGIAASGLAHAHQRGDDLVRESDPRSTLEMLSEWENDYGLPDSCTGANDTIEERRLALVQKIVSTGGQSRPYFIELARLLGYEIEIIEFRPFLCGRSLCGVNTREDTFGKCLIGMTDNINIRFYWQVKVIGPRITWFQCGQSECGKDPQAKISRADDLECLFRRYQPAHSELIFSYEGV